MIAKAPVTFLVLAYAAFGALGVLMNRAEANAYGEIALFVLCGFGFCVTIVPVLRAMIAVGRRPVRDMIVSALAVAAAVVVGQFAAKAMLGEFQFDALTLEFAVGMAALVAAGMLGFMVLLARSGVLVGDRP